jgi:hypothetical protein
MISICLAARTAGSQWRPVEHGEAVSTATCDLDRKATSLKPSANGQAEMRIVIDNQNAAHDGLLAVTLRVRPIPHLLRCDFHRRESVRDDFRRKRDNLSAMHRV